MLRNLRLGILAAAITVLAACSMVQSNLIANLETGTCESDAGFYYLPKTLITVQIKRGYELNAAKQADPARPFHFIEVGTRRIVDSKFGYCLDYLRNATSDDTIAIKKYKDQHILASVVSVAVDRSREIFETLLRTIFVGVSGNPGFDPNTGRTRSILATEGGMAIVYKADIDPFDPIRSAALNHILKDFGFCLILDVYTVDLTQHPVSSYCEDPVATQQGSPRAKLDYKFGPQVVGPRLTRGLFYRPRIPYKYYLYIKQNLQARGGWKLRAAQVVELENIAPVISVGVDRNFFGQRNTSLLFNEGLLQTVCIFNTAQLVEMVKIPLVVVQSVVALPANIIQVRIDQTNGRGELLKAETELLKQQQRYLALLYNKEGSLPPAGSFTNESAISIDASKTSISAVTEVTSTDRLGIISQSDCTPSATYGAGSAALFGSASN